MIKKIIFLLISCLPYAIYAQADLETTFTTEGIESVITSTESIIDDPMDLVSEYPGVSTNEENSFPEYGLDLGMEMLVTKNNKVYSIPLSFSHYKWNFRASIPYYFQRQMNYALKEAETSGLGDIYTGIGYNFEVFNLDFYSELGIKLPTGDDVAKDGSYLVPLGSGSTDFSLLIAANKTLNDDFNLGFGAFIKQNGESSKTGEIIHNDNPDGDINTTDITSLKYDVTNGNLFKVYTRLDWFLSYGFSADFKLIMKIFTEGSTDKTYSYSWNDDKDKFTGISNKQDMLLIDFTPKITYSISLFEIGLGLNFPLVTNRNDDNLEEERSISSVLKFNYNFF